MPKIEVMLDVPRRIATGLATGRLERVGGVVRDARTKQVVAWLREGGKIASNTELAGGIFKTVLEASSGVLQSNLAGATNVSATSLSPFLIRQQIYGLTNLVGLVGGIGVLNLATSVVTTKIVLNRLRVLEEAIEALYVNVTRQFSNARKVKMLTAIQTANNALTMEGQENRDFQANSAINALFAARQHIWGEVDNLKGSAVNAANNEVLQENILQAMQLDSLRSQCLLELNNTALARNCLSETLVDYRETSRQLIHRHLGEHRAVYFHQSVAESDLIRYLAIEHWLRPEGNRLMEIVLANRHDFWNPDIADRSKVVTTNKSAGFKVPFKAKQESNSPSHLDALTESELLIENLARFEGFLAEIEAIQRLGLMQSEWEQQQNEALAKEKINLEEHDDYAVLVDNEWLAEQSDSPAA